MKVTFPVLVPFTRGLDKRDKGKRPLYILQESFLFRVNGGNGTDGSNGTDGTNGTPYIVPAGFEFDYASVPRVLWSLFPPYDPEYAAASLIHDWLYGGELCPRKMADDVFLAAMVHRGVAGWKRTTMYAAVRAAGGFTYKEHTKESIREIRMLSGLCGTDRPLWRTI